LRAKRLRRVRNVRCLRSIFCILSFPHCVLLGRKMPLIDTRFVCVIVRDAQGGEQGLEFQEHCILAGIHHLGQYSPGVMIDRMPQPPLGRFGPDETPPGFTLEGQK
jgi:hypothetical protein